MSKRKQTNISCFFKNPKKSKSEDVHMQDGAGAGPSTSRASLQTEHTDPGQSLQPQESRPIYSQSEKYDIANYVGKSNITDEEIYNVLTKHWVPSKSYVFPTNIESGQIRKFNLKWLSDNPWLSYSKQEEGVYCRVCVIFGPKEAGMKNKTPLGNLVVRTLKKYKHAIELFRDHNKNEYHKLSLLKSTEFLKRYENPENKVDVLLDSKINERINENRKRLVPIVKTIILCGTENIALRGHRDDGTLDLQEKGEHEGKFRALLRFRIDAGDSTLKDHLQTAPKNATFISKTTQNELIECCGDIIVEQIIKKVKKSQFFSLIADETRDASSTEQMTVCLRYLDIDLGQIKEMFVGFVEAKDELTGEKLSALILEKLQELGLDISNLRGQAYDGGSNMAGHFQGVQARIKQLNPLALYIHCASHQLNLVLSHACLEPSIRNACGTIKEVINFVKDSAQRVHKMENILTEQHPEEKRHKLISLCETRFVERHDAITFFLQVFDSVLTCLDVIDKEKPTSKSACLLFSIRRFDFIIALHILGTTLDLTKKLSEDLQSPNVELQECYAMANTVIKLFQRYRSEEIFYNRIFDAAVKVATQHDIEIKSPRTVKAQIHRSNAEASSPRDYYRINVFIPFLDALICEMKNRFSTTNTELTQLFSLVPSFIKPAEYDDEIVNVAKKYCGESSSFQLYNEIAMWREHWNQSKGKVEVPSTAIEAFCDSSVTFYPNIKNLLHLLCVLPVTSCTCERSFSSMKLIKNYLRTTMRQDRLNGLALMNIHKNTINVDPLEVTIIA